MSINNKNIIVTGGCGFIGSFLTERLCKENSVCAIDNLSRGKLSNIEECNCDFINIDLMKEKIPKDILKSTDIVFHLASSVGSYKYYEDNALEILKTNTKIDWNVFESAIEADIDKLWYASSSHVYPAILQQKINAAPLSEEQAFPCNPSLSYGWNKISSEKYLKYYNGKMKIAIGRYNGIYGPRQSLDLKRGSIIPVLIERAHKYPNIPYKILSDGLEERSFCFIHDAIDATIKMTEALDNRKLVGPYNIGKQEKISIKDLALLIKRLINPEIKLEIDTQIEPKILCQWCNCSKIKKDIGWEANTTLKEGIEKII